MSTAGDGDDGLGSDKTQLFGSQPATPKPAVPRPPSDAPAPPLVESPPPPRVVSRSIIPGPNGETDDSDDGLSAQPTLLRDPRVEEGVATQATVLGAIDPSTVIQSRGERERREERGLGVSTRASGTPVHKRYREPEIGAVLGGKYELVRVLGVGGMGKVWKGQHLGFGVPIAVKTMHPHVASLPEYVRRFHREAHAMSLLSHPNVVRVFDFGEEDGILYLVMEFLEGRSLAAWLNKRALPPPIAEVTEIMSMLFDAFEVAHAFGIVHRDVKPDNVFLAEVGTKTLLKVLDFGLAHVDDHRDAGPTLTSIESVAGTPEYMSPEQCRSLVVGPSADLYSLGCVLTTMLQLKPPFRSQGSVETLANHMFSPPPPLDRPEGAEVVPPLLERLRLDLLAKTPERRPHDAAAAKARLLEAMSAEGEERRLPGRKGDVPVGEREKRAVTWAGAGDAASEVSAREAPKESRAIAVLRLAPAGSPVGIDATCITGLSAQSIQATVAASVDEVKRLGLPVVVLDVGSGVASAEAQLAALRAAVPDAKVLVCAAGLSAAQISGLVSAGAADALRYPIASDALARKIDRVLRRGR